MPIEKLTEEAVEEIESPESEGMEMEAEAVSETVQIPTTLLGGKTVSPGDVVRLEVVDVDEDGGFVNVKYSQPKAPPKKQGVEAMAAEFD